ncbi:hypothetical protein E2C01_090522 [Portunus trituberculatus]|uniref:Uncharacterized protein n=1 Tax=Portunus trituberculatus TaxID=210409 RepID=A0A5B7JM01_PORTR|nr:hypothetical protein [Portunus trituberculatus]
MLTTTLRGVCFTLHHCGLAEARFGDHRFAPFSYTPQQVPAGRHPEKRDTTPDNTRYPFTAGWTGAQL